MRSATELIFGMLQIYTYVRSNLTPIWKILVFGGPSSSFFRPGRLWSLRNFQGAAGFPIRNVIRPQNDSKMIFSNPLKFSEQVFVLFEIQRISQLASGFAISQKANISTCLTNISTCLEVSNISKSQYLNLPRQYLNLPQPISQANISNRANISN